MGILDILPPYIMLQDIVSISEEKNRETVFRDPFRLKIQVERSTMLLILSVFFSMVGLIDHKDGECLYVIKQFNQFFHL